MWGVVILIERINIMIDHMARYIWLHDAWSELTLGERVACGGFRFVTGVNYHAKPERASLEDISILPFSK